MARIYAALRSHPDGAALGLVVLVGAALRLAFLFRAPPFYVGGDSATYLQPALELLQGLGFDPVVKRPPLYPLFLAGELAVAGLDLQGVNLAQHLLGLATAAAAWGLGRLTFGRAAALLAGLATALNGPLLIYEHYIMAETLFTCLLTLALLSLVAAARRPGWGLPLLAGSLFGLASATRQSAQAVAALVPLAFWLVGRGIGPAVRSTGLVLVGFITVLAPWFGFDYARHQVLSSGTLGETLIWRLTRSGPEKEFFQWRLAPVADPRQQEARKFAFGQAADRVLPSDTKVSLQQRFRLSEAEADLTMRSIGFEAIARRPDLYLTSSSSLLIEHLLGSEQWLGGQGKKGGVERYADVESKYESWWTERTRPLVQNASPGQEREFRRAQMLANLFQPYRYGWVLLGLFAVGAAASLARPAWRLGLVPAAAALLLLGLAAFLAGDLPRYRYPADPLLAVVQAGGAVALGDGLRRAAVGLASRARPAPRLRPTREQRAGGEI